MAVPSPTVTHADRLAALDAVYRRLLSPLPDEESGANEATDEATDGDNRADEAA